MQFDLMLEGGPLDQIGTAERVGGAFDAAWSIEAKHDPFTSLAAVAARAEGLRLGTAVAVAFARNPMQLASLGNDLQLLARGGFTLGLGSQVRQHIERRYSMPWDDPIQRMRETVAAIRAIWRAWADCEPLDFRGEFYQHTLMTPAFSPGPNPFGAPPIFLGALGPRMTSLAAEVADGLVIHRLMSAEYLRDVTIPAVNAARDGSSRPGFEIVFRPFVIATDADPDGPRGERWVRRQVAFYASTPSYKRILEYHGWAATAERLREGARDGDWSGMGELITDEVLATFAIILEGSDERGAIANRFSGLVDRVIVHSEDLAEGGFEAGS